MSIINALRTYIATYSGLASGSPLWVDHLGTTSGTEYSIIPLPGEKAIEEYIDGSSLREFPFALMSNESTADDLERIENSGFFENFSAWLDAQTLAGVFPTLGTKQTPEKIEAVSPGYLFEQGDSETGFYRIECRLEYSQGV